MALARRTGYGVTAALALMGAVLLRGGAADGAVLRVAQQVGTPGPTPTDATPAGAGSQGVTTTTRATFGLGPAGPSAIDRRPYFNYLVSRGAKDTDHVAVVNIGDIPLTLSLYSTDAANGTDGSSGLLSGSEKPTQAGRWVSLQNASGSGVVTLTVAPRSTVIVPFTVAVPLTATPGDHAGGIVATLATFARNKKGDLVRIDQRIAVRTFFRVFGPLHPQIRVENVHTTYHQNWNPIGKGSVTVRYTVANRGNVELTVKQRVSFADPLKKYQEVAQGPPSIPLLLPGYSGRMSVRVHKVLPLLFGRAQIQLTPLPVLRDADPGLVAVNVSVVTWTVPVVLLIIVVLLIGGLWYRRRRRMRPGRPPEVGAPAPVKQGIAR